MSGFSKIREKLGRLGGAETGRSQRPDSSLPLDHQINNCQYQYQNMNFKDGNIYSDNKDLDSMVNEKSEDVSFQTRTSADISDYKDHARKSGITNQAFYDRADGIQDKILCNMKRLYDEKTGGLRLKWGDGAYLLNNLNIRQLLALHHIRPTDKSAKFLDGLKSKLALILTNKNGSPNYEHLSRVVKSLYCEVEDALNETPVNLPRLNSGSGNNIA